MLVQDNSDNSNFTKNIECSIYSGECVNRHAAGIMDGLCWLNFGLIAAEDKVFKGKRLCVLSRRLNSNSINVDRGGCCS